MHVRVRHREKRTAFGTPLRLQRGTWRYQLRQQQAHELEPSRTRPSSDPVFFMKALVIGGSRGTPVINFWCGMACNDDRRVSPAIVSSIHTSMAKPSLSPVEEQSGRAPHRGCLHATRSPKPLSEGRRGEARAVRAERNALEYS